MGPRIEVSKHCVFKEQPDQQRRDQRQDHREPKAPGKCGKGEDQVGADHVLYAMGKVDEPHHPKDERETGCDQKEEQTILQPVQAEN